MTNKIVECIKVWYSESAKGVRDTDTNSEYFVFNRDIFRLAQKAKQYQREGNFSMVLEMFWRAFDKASSANFPLPVACYIGLLLLEKEEMNSSRAKFVRPKFKNHSSFDE